MSGQILLVEDDSDMRRVTRLLLEREGYRVQEAGSAEDALAKVGRAAPDLLLADIGLPGMSGVKLCEILRSEPRTAKLPVILLTVRGSEMDKVTGLKTGADDYVTKPYSARELLARVESVLRRARDGGHSTDRFEFEGLAIDAERRQVTVDGVPVTLTRKEFELLTFFARHAGQLLTRDRIVRSVWGEQVVLSENTLSVHIWHLRSALGAHGKRLETLVGEGYRFRE